MKVTKILHSYQLNPGKYAALEEQAFLLGEIRTGAWEKFGAVAGLKLKDRQVRDMWMAEKRKFAVPANAWKETLRDAMGNIKAYREAAKEKVKKAIRERTSDDVELKRLDGLLKYDNWKSLTKPQPSSQITLDDRSWTSGNIVKSSNCEA